MEQDVHPFTGSPTQPAERAGALDVPAARGASGSEAQTDRGTDPGAASGVIVISGMRCAMLFNSYRFACFFILLLPTYWLLGRWYRLQNLLLLGAGYYFYACWNPKFLSLLILSTAMDYPCLPCSGPSNGP